MRIFLELLRTARPKSSLPDSVFGAIGALANALEGDFAKYMESFKPFLFSALSKSEEPEVCAIGVGLVSDLSRSLNEAVQPYCDDFMNLLLQTLQVYLLHPHSLKAGMCVNRINSKVTISVHRSSLLFFNALGTLLKQLVANSRSISALLQPSCSMPQRSRSQSQPLILWIMSPLYERGSWMAGEA